MYKGY